MKNKTGRDEVTTEDLFGMRDQVKQLVEYESVIQRIWGFFSFVNIMWFCAIIGLTVTVIPCVYFTCGEVLGKMVMDIIIPIVKLLNRLGVWEFLGYFLCN